MSWSLWTISKKTKAWCSVNTPLVDDDHDDNDDKDDDDNKADDDDDDDDADDDDADDNDDDGDAEMSLRQHLVVGAAHASHHHCPCKLPNWFDLNWYSTMMMMMMRVITMTVMMIVILMTIDNPNFRWEAALPHLLQKFFQQVKIVGLAKLLNKILCLHEILSKYWGRQIWSNIKYYAYLDFFRHYLQHHIKFVHSNERRYYFNKW